MNHHERALLLIGSAKRPCSTSESLGGYLIERLGERGYSTRKLLVYRSLASDEGHGELLAATDSADILILAFPLYVDSLPSLVIRTLESLAKHRLASGPLRTQRLVAIVNSGFPEAHHNDTALAICRRFAKEAGFEWCGGLALGGGEAINGQPLSKMKLLARNVIKSLDQAAESLARGGAIPQDAVNLMAKPLVPNWMYVWLGERRWWQRAKKRAVQEELNARPYQRVETPIQ
jgi:hypothetical protein